MWYLHGLFSSNEQTKKSDTVLQNQREATSEKRMSIKKTKSVLHFPLVTPCWACLPLTSKQCSQEKQPTTQIPHRPVMSIAHKKVQSTWMKKFQIKKTKIKLHKIFSVDIFTILDFLSFFCSFLIFFFLPITVMLHQSKAFPFICSISYDMQVPLLSFCLPFFPSWGCFHPHPSPLLKVIIHHIPLYWHRRPNHRSLSITSPCSTASIRNKTA